VVFSKKYPDIYLKRKYRVSPEAAAAIPDSVDKLIEGMPGAFDPRAAGDLKAEIQFDISGEKEESGSFPSPGGTARFAGERPFLPRSPSNLPGMFGSKFPGGRSIGRKLSWRAFTGSRAT